MRYSGPLNFRFLLDFSSTKDSTPIKDCHSSICKIKDRCITNDCSSELFFKPVSDEFVEKQINKINIKKATGIDQISFKILKIAKPCCGSSNYSAYKFIN